VKPSQVGSMGPRYKRWSTWANYDKNRMTPTSSVLTQYQHATDGQTDGRTDTPPITKSRYSTENFALRLLFDFGVINTTDDDCELQGQAFTTVLLTTSPARRRSCLVYNSCGLTPSRIGSRVNICTFLSRVSTLTRDIDITILSVPPSVRPSLRYVPVFYGNGLTYCYIFKPHGSPISF